MDRDFGFRVWQGKPAVMGAAHQHMELELNFLLTGSMRYLLAGRPQAVAERRLVALWGGTPHELIEASAGAECIWITIPLAWVLAWGVPQTFTSRLLSGELLVDPEHTNAEHDLVQQRRWGREVDSDPEGRRIVVLEVEARVRRLALCFGKTGSGGMTASGLAGPARRPEAMAERIARYIGAHYSEKLSVEQIAASAGLHPNYAMTVFKQSCGLSIWDYLTRLRVSHAQRLLVTTDWKILEIALESGFGSASRFYETFSKVTGQTPRAYRQLSGLRQNPKSKMRLLLDVAG